MDAEQIANLAQHKARIAYQAALDLLVAGDLVERAALELRYRPIALFQKEGPDVGQRQEAESQAGRVN
jgi:hypothetical protein